MNISADKAKFRSILNQFNPMSDKSSRMLALFSAAITFDDALLTEQAIQKAVMLEISRDDLYEIILQSYLFLGFPRMLQAADVLQNISPRTKESFPKEIFLSKNSLPEWYKKGEEVCGQVYNDKYELLKNRVLDFAPEIFHWMILEGYGKVLSRKKLPLIARELSIVAFLTMENRVRQLHSHILGAINVGASKSLVWKVVNDLGDSAGDGYTSACDILDKAKVSA